MVEGPQATYQANWIKKRFKNKTLESIEIVKGRYKKNPPKNITNFQNLFPLRLKDIVKKGKVIFLFFEKDWVVIIKFGMTAWVSDEESDPNIIFDFGKDKLFYKDLRQFGTLTFTNDSTFILKEMDKIAPDVLDPSTNFESIRENISSNKSMDQILMDQKIVLSGIGNIMKSEILYDAKINPKRKGSDLSVQEWKRVLYSAKKIARKIFSNIQNDKQDFLGVMKVYDKKIDKLGHRIKSYKSKDGRTTYWAPSIQK
jgi:formamidopyrimidine-DNA glycosylase